MAFCRKHLSFAQVSATHLRIARDWLALHDSATIRLSAALLETKAGWTSTYTSRSTDSFGLRFLRTEFGAQRIFCSRSFRNSKIGITEKLSKVSDPILSWNSDLCRGILNNKTSRPRSSRNWIQPSCEFLILAQKCRCQRNESWKQIACFFYFWCLLFAQIRSKLFAIWISDMNF